MVADKPNVVPTSRYSINQASAFLGIHRNTLRKYTDAGLIKCDIRKSTWKKFYTGLEILRFWSATI